MAAATTPLPPTAEPPRKRRRPRSYHGVAMDVDAFLALPDDGSDRWLLDGVVHEWLPATRERMTIRTLEHSENECNVSFLLKGWQKAGGLPFKVHSGEVGVRLRPNDATVVGADVIVRRLDMPVEKRGKRGSILAGVPVAVVEVLSESDRVASVNEKVATYVAAGVPLVWIVDPFQKLLHVHRGTVKGQTLGVGDTLDGGAALPGFSVPLAEVFE